MVEVLEDENIVGYSLAEQTAVLNDIAVAATKVIQPTIARSDMGSVEPAIKTLCILCRIEFDIVSPHISSILLGLLSVSQCDRCI